MKEGPPVLEGMSIPAESCNAPAPTPHHSLPLVSAFLHTPEIIPYSPTPSIIHLKRDLLLPLSFQPPEASSSEPEHRDGRAAAFNSKGILNTRFGDFPHSSIVGIPYGSQVCAAASAHNSSGRKRKRKEDSSAASTPQTEPDRSTGFLHVLAPTAELWTASLPHRTQVVYTPDSSYILHKLRARPGSVLIEAGAGSGSFTHAAVRAVYRGYPDGRDGGEVTGKRGMVFSFEFHKERVEKLTDEIGRHGLDGLVEIVHRDVCKDGFLLERKKTREEGVGKECIKEEDIEEVSPRATAIFLDLPAPWLALPHLTRRARPTPSLPTSSGLTPSSSPGLTPKVEGAEDSPVTANPSVPLQEFQDPPSSSAPKVSPSAIENSTVPLTSGKALGKKAASSDRFDSTKLSALSPDQAVRICTFSPCIEQVTRTVSVLRKLGWVDIEMVEVQHRRIEVRRQNPKGYEDGAGPRTVREAVQRLKWVGEYREQKMERDKADSAEKDSPAPSAVVAAETWKSQNGGEKRWMKDGRITTRIEPEIKSHTSYLVFAVLPREWSVEDEEAAAALVRANTKGVVNIPADTDVKRNGKPKWKGKQEEQAPSKRQIKKAERQKRKEQIKGAKGGKDFAEEGAMEGGAMEEEAMQRGAIEERVMKVEATEEGTVGEGTGGGGTEEEGAVVAVGIKVEEMEVDE